MSAAFVAAMEDVLDLYAEPYNPQRPTVCVDEKSKQLIAEIKVPLPIQPSRPERYDFEYRRNGTCNLCMFIEPRADWRHVAVTAHRTRLDFAHQLKWLAEERYPAATVIRVVLDNLNTHGTASLYEAFPPAEARRLAKRLEFHYTPKHGSWLNMAELELSVFERSCWARRIGDEPTLVRESAALEAERNAVHASIHWQFTTDKARIHLKRLYPSIPA